jgi:hypothetical protein
MKLLVNQFNSKGMFNWQWPVLAISMLLLSSCGFQGPWEYKPEKQDIYRGIWVYGHIVADRPIQDLCFEKLYSLDETWTEAFAFFDSAQVQVTGVFSGQSQTVVTIQHPSRANCFVGDSSLLAQPGESYTLNATIWWDSAGTAAQSILSGVAYVPTNFKVVKGLTRPEALPFQQVSDSALTVDSLLSLYGDTLTTLLSDTAALSDFLTDNPDLMLLLVQLFPDQADSLGFGAVDSTEQDDQFVYIPFASGDTLRYLNQDLKLSGWPHKLVTSYSEDVGGVLISHFFDSTGGEFESLFSNFGGFAADTGDYASSGFQHRNQYYLAQSDIDGTNIIDSLPLFNLYLKAGLNRFVVYGTDTAYGYYVQTAIVENESAKVQKRYNIEGGAGFFSGFIADTIDIYITVMDSAKYFPFAITRPYNCRYIAQPFADESKAKNGDWPKSWTIAESAYCRELYQPHCESVGYNEVDCIGASVYQSYLQGQSWDYYYDSLSLDFGQEQVTKFKNWGDILYCTYEGFPQNSTAPCDSLQIECQQTEGENDCKTYLWIACEDVQWDYETHPQCGPALVSYVKDKNVNSSILEKQVNNYCKSHPEVYQCQR